MKYILMTLILALCSLAGRSYADGCGVKVTYPGQGAGKVIFDGAVHLSKGIPCDRCHEGQGFNFALFEKKRGSTIMSMKKMENGRSCGYCHDGKKSFSVADMTACSRCHQK